MIVIGLGSGRSGTASLAKLLNGQRDALCFHEMNPACVRFEGTPRPILNTIEEFEAIVAGGDPSRLTVDLSRAVSAQAYERLRAMGRVRLIGDIAHYYLRYVETIAARHPSVRFVCLKRDKAKTVQSWLSKTSFRRWPSKALGDRLASLLTREPYFEARNPWMAHDGTRWAHDPVWDKCFPNYPGPTREDAVSQYWDDYYQEAERLARRWPERFRVVETERLDEAGFQAELLAFCGVEPAEQVRVEAHAHKLVSA